MCGIAGIIYRDGTQARSHHISFMLEKIKHRGPDGEGIHIHDNIALGHRRLAIIDLVTGHQPMSNEDESIWITFNGEIYNHLDLRNDLEKRGHIFKTNSDTEVIIHLYEEYGTELVQYLRGMFAFGIADFSAKKMILVRDHFGIKPLYYRLQPHFFTFASELPALRIIEESPPIGDLLMVDLFLRFSYIPSPNTIFKDIFKLNPGSILEISFTGDIIKKHQYWIPELNQHLSEKLPVDVNKIDSAIEESVSAHLISDVPFGILLSGGVDSSIIAIKMAKLLKNPVTSFTINFDDDAFSEIKYANALVERIQLNGINELIKEDSLKLLPDLISHFGEPFGDPSIIPTWYVAKLARSEVPMVLSGDGGDETFAGYLSYLQWLYSFSFIHIIKTFTKDPQFGLHLIGGYIIKKVQKYSKYPSFLWEKNVRFTKPSLRRKLWKKEFRHLVHKPAEPLEIILDKSTQTMSTSFAQTMDYRSYLPSDILSKVDIMSMYHGLEVRTPLIDRKIFQIAQKIPDVQKFEIINNEGLITKSVLRKILLMYMPAEYVFRPKWGFVPPYRNWFLSNGKARKLLITKMEDPKSHLQQWFHKDAILKLLEEQSRGKDRSLILWLLLIIGIWSDQNQDIIFE